ncbi:MAG: GerMN domain-containing protein [Oscillospiraceae bacterium]|nr:GerMN domain-containing protein [Oscillospiraceae bacterium]
MKRVLGLLLLLGLLLSACGTSRKEESGFPLDFYYPAREPYSTGSFISARRYYDGKLPAAVEALEQYLTSSIPEKATSAIPAGWIFNSAKLGEDGTLEVHFSGKSASAMEETMAAACLTQTLCQLETVLRLKLCPPGDREPLLLSANDFLSMDLSMEPQKTEVVLYYPDSELQSLRKEVRQVENMEASEMPRYIVEQLLQGTAIGEAHGCIPVGTSLLNIDEHNGICTVNLSSHFTRDMSEDLNVVRLAVYSLVNSLTELSFIHTIDLQVAYAPPDSIAHLKLNQGFTRDESLIYREDATRISIYPQITELGELVQIPLYLPMREDVTIEEQVLRALLEYRGSNGISGTVPAGTSVLSMQLAEGLCIVDLTAAFLAEGMTREMEEVAVKSIVATLCALPEVKTVEILVEGLTPEYQNSELEEIRHMDLDWIYE